MDPGRDQALAVLPDLSHHEQDRAADCNLDGDDVALARLVHEDDLDIFQPPPLVTIVCHWPTSSREAH